MGRKKHKYFLYRVEDNEMIFSSPYFDDIEEYIDNEISVNQSRNVEDYYIVNEKGNCISIEAFENDGYH